MFPAPQTQDEYLKERVEQLAGWARKRGVGWAPSNTPVLPYPYSPIDDDANTKAAVDRWAMTEFNGIQRLYMYDNEGYIDPFSHVPEKTTPKCTCGAWKTYGKDSRVHSEWCDVASECKPPELTGGIYHEESDT